MPGQQFAYLESYSSFAPPPMRGFVITANWSHLKPATTTLPIVGVFFRRRDTYSRPKPDAKGPDVARNV